ncbi:VOC family protein [Salinisphaera sp.]|uniref:VOC family protein n=1 Tax=Salinisphaera sp. TaxID=1914330 RepID=UPI000C619A76|nr:VOC family protein [Salinisphaera sp.]MBS63402.1 glyoxalase/bleomycin resistance/dioxygenase family protein [Salinisphaera sp.]
MKLDLLVLRCRQLEPSRQFYESLGFRFAAEKHGTGPLHYAAVGDGFVFELYPASANEAVDNTRLGFGIEHIPQSLAQVPETTTREFDGTRIYIVRDPDGRKIELREKTAS